MDAASPHASAVLVNNFVDHAIFLGLFGIHDEIPLDVFLDALYRLAAVLRKKLVDHAAHAQDFLGMQIDIGGLAAETGEPGLMNEDARVGQGEALFGRAASEKDGGDGGSLSDAGGNHVGFYKLHGVVDGETRGDGAAGGIDIELDVALGIFGLEEKHLGGGEVGDVIVNGRTYKNDVLFQEAGVNVVGTFAAAGLLDHHGYKRCGAVGWIVESFHVRYARSGPNLCFTLTLRRQRCEFGNSARASREFYHSAA